MVQYVLTPWRDRAELLLVRRQFYISDFCGRIQPSPKPAGVDRSTKTPGGGRRPGEAHGPHLDQSIEAPAANNQQRWCRQQQHEAVARVSMWMHRGGCPHMVESTALLMAAMLSDEDPSRLEPDARDARSPAANAAASTYAARAAYSSAFSRFVTGLLDGHQDKQRKQSMYSIAKTIGLPATFVELRHQSTHEQLPSRAKLRSAAQKALDWIWDYYWKHLGEDYESPLQQARDEYTEAVLSYLRAVDAKQQDLLLQGLRQRDMEQVLQSLAALQKEMPGNQFYLRCIELRKALMAEPSSSEQQAAQALGQHAKEKLAEEPAETTSLPVTPGLEDAAMLETGWSRWEGPWTPKPIGIV